MKKSIIALSIASVFAAPTFAATQGDYTYAKVVDVENAIKSAEISGHATVIDGPQSGSVVIHDNKTGEAIIVKKTDDGYTITERDNTITEVGVEDGEIRTINGEEAMNKPVMPDVDNNAENHNSIEDMKRDIEQSKDVYANDKASYASDKAAAESWAQQAEAKFNQEVSRLDKKIDTVEGRVSNGAAMTGAMSQMQFGRDGLGMGVGVANFNGSNAISVGVGYAFGSDKEWMAKGSLGYAESNKGSGSKDGMAAAGLTYSFN